jgi:hypothetical protein
MDENILLGKVSELHKVWWEAVWSELAWGEHGREPAEFALTIKEGWDKFDRVADILSKAGLDQRVLLVEFETKGDPSRTSVDDYAQMAEKAKCAS